MANSLLDAVRASPATSRDNATVIVARVTALDGEAPLPGATAGDGAAALDADATVTTAIVTTPFYKTGRPGSRSEHADVAPQGIIATPPSAAIAAATGPKPAKVRLAEETFIGDGPASTASAPAAAPASAGGGASRKRGLWLWLLLLVILGGAALAFAYHRDLLPR